MFFGIKPFIIGLTIISIGTSLPELISSIIATLKDSSEIVIGNVIGSNIANICLILGLAAIMSSRALLIEYDLLNVDLPLFTGGAFFLALTVTNQNFSFGEAGLCVFGFFIYLLYVINSGARAIEENIDEKAPPSERVKGLYLRNLSF